MVFKSYHDRWLETYENKGAIWIHGGNPNQPHVILTSGKHSSGFFDSELIMENPRTLFSAAGDLVQLLLKEGLPKVKVNRVVGPAMGAVTLVDHIATQITNLTNQEVCLRGHAEKTGEANEKKMVLKRTKLQPRESILLAEDVITTGTSVTLTAAAVEEKGGIILPWICALVNRSNLEEIDGRKIIALVTHPMPTWTPEECPLCEQGSKAIPRPKETANWARLNADY